MLVGSVLDLACDDGIELLLGDQSIMVDISPHDQFLKFLFGDILADFLGDSSEVLDGDEAGAFVVEEGEDLVDVDAGVAVADLLGQQVQPLLEVDVAVAVGVQIGDHLEDRAVFGLET